MSQSAGDQLNRIVSLVAELTRGAAGGSRGPEIGDLASHHGTTAQQIRRDVATLTAVSEDAGAEWLSSIVIAQEGDRLSVQSRGPFRRPVRLTVPELTAIQIGLAAESDPPPALAGEFATLLNEKDAVAGPTPEVRIAPTPTEAETTILRLAKEALDGMRLLRIKYAGAGDRVGVDRIIEPHDVVHDQGRYYIVAWCRLAEGWRNFRADRVLDAAIGFGSFSLRDEVPTFRESGGVFRSDEELDAVDVRFSPDIARWIVERYPDARPDADGGVIVTYRVADPQWLARTVLQYGEDAEVLAPELYRDVVRKVLRQAPQAGGF